MKKLARFWQDVFTPAFVIALLLIFAVSLWFAPT